MDFLAFLAAYSSISMLSLSSIFQQVLEIGWPRLIHCTSAGVGERSCSWREKCFPRDHLIWPGSVRSFVAPMRTQYGVKLKLQDKQILGQSDERRLSHCLSQFFLLTLIKKQHVYLLYSSSWLKLEIFCPPIIFDQFMWPMIANRFPTFVLG